MTPDAYLPEDLGSDDSLIPEEDSSAAHTRVGRISSEHTSK